jgi:hypothetical protein
MEIKDLQGMVIKVTDLEGSIAQVEEFMGYHHIHAEESLQRFDQERYKYWKDFYEKLLLLREQTKTTGL